MCIVSEKEPPEKSPAALEARCLLSSEAIETARTTGSDQVGLAATLGGMSKIPRRGILAPTLAIEVAGEGTTFAMAGPVLAGGVARLLR